MSNDATGMRVGILGLGLIGGSFARAYRAALGVPGISLIEVPLALAGLRERFGARS